MGIAAAVQRLVMIGDDIFTDIGGAQASGIRGILVKTGKFREDVFEKSTIRPAAVLNTVGDIQDLIK